MGVLTTHLPEITKEQITIRIEKMRNYALLSKKCKKKVLWWMKQNPIIDN